jgi:signal peptidase II
MRIYKRLLLIFMLLTSCVGCDQTTKSVAKTYLSETETVSLVAGSVRLQVAKNYGAFLSLGDSLPASWRAGLLLGGVGLVLASLLSYALLAKVVSVYSVSGVGLFIGGGLSNLIDRLQYGGYVVDFINLGIGPLRTGVFNLADVAIKVGVFALVFSGPLERRASNKAMQATCEDARA